MTRHYAMMESGNPTHPQSQETIMTITLIIQENYADTEEWLTDPDTDIVDTDACAIYRETLLDRMLEYLKSDGITAVEIEDKMGMTPIFIVDGPVGMEQGDELEAAAELAYQAIVEGMGNDWSWLP